MLVPFEAPGDGGEGKYRGRLNTVELKALSKLFNQEDDAVFKIVQLVMKGGVRRQGGAPALRRNQGT
jgi:hypothetical protein